MEFNSIPFLSVFFSPSETNERWFLRSALVYLPRDAICRRLRFVSSEANSRRRRSRAIGHFVSCLSVTLRENDVNASHGNGTRDTFDSLAVLPSPRKTVVGFVDVSREGRPAAVAKKRAEGKKGSV